MVEKRLEVEEREMGKLSLLLLEDRLIQVALPSLRQALLESLLVSLRCRRGEKRDLEGERWERLELA